MEIAISYCSRMNKPAADAGIRACVQAFYCCGNFSVIYVWHPYTAAFDAVKSFAKKVVL